VKNLAGNIVFEMNGRWKRMRAIEVGWELLKDAVFWECEIDYESCVPALYPLDGDC